VRELKRVSTDPQQADFPEAKQFLRSHNHTSFNNKPKEPAPTPDEDLTRYFISSWDASEKRPQSMAEMVRSHWCCESRHWQRDACWREDKCLLHSPNAACAIALVRATLQSLLRWSGQSSLPIVFENVAHDLSLGIGWLKSRHLHR
jgi:predicted transposase YbfD/YdcC